MAKRQVVEIVCDRCSRTEYIEPDKYTEAVDLRLYFGHKPNMSVGTDSNSLSVPEITVNFDDLCSSCQKTVRNLIGQIRLEAKKKGDDDPGESPDKDSPQDGTTPPLSAPSSSPA